MENIPTLTPEIPVVNQTESALQTPKTNYLNLILISLCFVLFLTGAYYLGKQSSIVPEISVTPIKTPVAILPKTTAIPTNITDQTTNWKTYIDSKYGFSFKYPSNLEIEEDGGGIGMAFVFKAEIEQPGLSSYFGFQYWPEYTISKYIDHIKKNISAPNTQVTSGSLTISNNKFTLIKYTDAMDNREQPVFQIGNDLIVFSDNNQILSTFKFTENKAEDINMAIKNNVIAQNPKLNLSIDEISIGQTQINSNYVSAAVNLSSGGGYVIYMTKINNVWQIVASGQEPPSCTVLAKYNFPKEFGCNP